MEYHTRQTIAAISEKAMTSFLLCLMEEVSCPNIMIRVFYSASAYQYCNITAGPPRVCAPILSMIFDGFVI